MIVLFLLRYSKTQNKLKQAENWNTTLAGPEQLKSIKSQVRQADIIESLVRKRKVQVMDKILISKAQEAQTKSYV